MFCSSILFCAVVDLQGDCRQHTHAAVACLGGVAARSSIQGHENPDGIFSWDDQFEDVRE